MCHMTVCDLRFSTVTVRSLRHAGTHVRPDRSSPGTEPRRFETWTHHPGSCPVQEKTNSIINLFFFPLQAFKTD